MRTQIGVQVQPDKLRSSDQRSRHEGSRPRSKATDVLAISELLRDLGYGDESSSNAARALLEHQGITRPGKLNVHKGKGSTIRTLLNGSFRRTCGSTICEALAEGDSRTRLEVRPRDCEQCSGQRSEPAARRLIARLAAASVRRIVVLGGAPGTHQALRRWFARSSIRLDLIDGTRPVPSARAAALAAADIIVVWSSTILDHGVSASVLNVAPRQKVVLVPKRGVEALAAFVGKHVDCRTPQTGGAR